MTENPIRVTESASISDAAITMARNRIRHLLVTAGRRPGGRPVGIVSGHDVARAFPPNLNPFSAGALDRRISRPVSEIMAQDLRTVSPDTPIEEAARMIREHRIGALPVIRRSRVVGIITRSDILRALMDMLGAEGEGTRVTFDLSADEEAVVVVARLARRCGCRLASVVSLKRTGRHLAMVWLTGGHLQQLVDGLWRSGHRVLSVHRGHTTRPRSETART